MTLRFLALLAVTLLLQRWLGPWGAPLVGLLAGVLQPAGAGRLAAGAAAVAALALLGLSAAQGAPVVAFAARLGESMTLPAWAPLVAAVVLPGLAAGGVAGGVGGLRRLLRSGPAA